MAKKKAFALRLDVELLDAIEKWAADEFRSTNGQLEWIIHQSLHKTGRLIKKTPDPESSENANDEVSE